MGGNHQSNESNESFAHGFERYFMILVHSFISVIETFQLGSTIRFHLINKDWLHTERNPQSKVHRFRILPEIVMVVITWANSQIK